MICGERGGNTRRDASRPSPVSKINTIWKCQSLTKQQLARRAFSLPALGASEVALGSKAAEPEVRSSSGCSRKTRALARWPRTYWQGRSCKAPPALQPLTRPQPKPPSASETRVPRRASLCTHSTRSGLTRQGQQTNRALPPKDFLGSIWGSGRLDMCSPLSLSPRPCQMVQWRRRGLAAIL
jgi:hypothetical protein